MSINKDEALRIGESLINQGWNSANLTELGPIVIIESATIEKSYGWVFFANTARYLESRDRRWSLIGDGVMIFESETGIVTVLPSYMEVDQLVVEYEKCREQGRYFGRRLVSME